MSRPEKSAKYEEQGITIRFSTILDLADATLNMGQRIFDKAETYIRRNNRKRLRRLLKKYRYLLTSDDSRIVYSAIWTNRGILPWLLDRGVNPDCRMGRCSNTPLMQAAADGDLNTMKVLLAHGADPNVRNEHNELPLGFACTWDQWEAAELLLNSGADPNGIEDDWGTHLDCMILSQKDEGIRMLKSHGAKTRKELAVDRNTE